MQTRRIGIDGSNLRSGGGVTHLAEFLRAADPHRHGFAEIAVWASRATLGLLPDRPWIRKESNVMLECGLVRRAWWQYAHLGAEARAIGCDVMLVPGGSYFMHFSPVVTMCRNMIPFEWREQRRFGFSAASIKFLLLRFVQARSFMKADGVIFLTQYARQVVSRALSRPPIVSAVIPHGVHERFLLEGGSRKFAKGFDAKNPLRLLYVSSVQPYKHHENVAKAVTRLHYNSVPVVISFVGSMESKSGKHLLKTCARLDPSGAVIKVIGPVDHAEIHEQYACADAFVFASSCENMPNILLEAMASGLPVACANMGPMPEVLGDCGVYFDPLRVSSIEQAILELIDSWSESCALGRLAHERAQSFLWSRCADATFEFIHAIANESR